MAYDFPSYEGLPRQDKEAELDALMIPQFEDLWKGDRHEGPDEVEDQEHQEFLAPEPADAGDFPEFSEALDPPDRGPPSHGPVVAEWPEDPEGGPLAPYSIQPEDHETPASPQVDSALTETPPPADVGDPQGSEATPFAFSPWAYPLPAGEQEEVQPSEYGPPGQQDDLEAPESDPLQPRTDGEPSAFEVPPPPDVQGQFYEQPAPPPVEMSANEDLFARTGWPAAPPRLVQTHWYM